MAGPRRPARRRAARRGRPSAGRCPPGRCARRGSARDHPRIDLGDRPPRRRVGAELRAAAEPPPPAWPRCTTSRRCGSPSWPTSPRSPTRPSSAGRWPGAPGSTPTRRFVRDEVIDHFGAPPERVVVVAPGVRPPTPGDPRPGHTAGRRRPLRRCRSARSSPARTCPTLVTAFDALAADDPDLRLVIAGQDGWGAEALTAAVAAAAHRDRIVRLGYVSDQDRDDLLRGATRLRLPLGVRGLRPAAPRGHERRARRWWRPGPGSIPEVCGDGADLVDVGDADALGAALGRRPDRRRAPRRARRPRPRHRRPATGGTTAGDAFAALLHRVARALSGTPEWPHDCDDRRLPTRPLYVGRFTGLPAGLLP